jgi:hypothetical protein
MEALASKLDIHIQEGITHRNQLSNQLSRIETTNESLSSSVSKLVEILERLTIVEERDRNRYEALAKIQIEADSLTTKMTDHILETSEKFGNTSKTIEKHIADAQTVIGIRVSRVSTKVDRMLWTFSGAIFVITLIGSIVGSYFLNKVIDLEKVAEDVKVHLRLDAERHNQ